MRMFRASAACWQRMLHAYMDAWWPAGHTIGYEHTFTHEVVELMNALAEDRQPVPNFVDGVKCQEVLGSCGSIYRRTSLG